MEQPPPSTSNHAEFEGNRDRERGGHGGARFGEGLGLFFGAFILLIVVGGITQRLVYGPGRGHAQQLGPLGIAFTELLAIFVPALLFARLRRRRGDALPFMDLSVPKTREGASGFLLGIGGGVLCGMGLFYLLSAFIEPLLEHFIPVPPEERAHLMRLLRPSSGLRPLWQDLLCFAAVPALCEELLFRGAILSTLGAKAGNHEGKSGALHPANLRAVLVSATLFGIFHLSPSKIFPTALLGIGFGFAAVLPRALWPAIFMHFTNNALVVVLIRAGLDEVPATAETPGRLIFLASGAFVLLALGTALLRIAGRKKRLEISP